MRFLHNVRLELKREIVSVWANSLHKLLVQCARTSGNNLFVNDHDFDDTIKATGERLVDALKQSELLPEALKENAIDQAFNEAMASLSQVSDSLNSHEVLPHFTHGWGRRLHAAVLRPPFVKRRINLATRFHLTTIWYFVRRWKKLNNFLLIRPGQ